MKGTPSVPMRTRKLLRPSPNRAYSAGSDKPGYQILLAQLLS